MNRTWWLGLMLLLGACASNVAPPPPPPPPPPPAPPPPPPPPPTPVEAMEAERLESTFTPSRTVVRSAHRTLRVAAAGPRTTAYPVNAGQPANAVASSGDGIEQGVAAFAKPPPMEVDHWYVVEFAAGPKEVNLREETEGRALTALTRVYVARTMRVTLLDNPAFEIKPKTASEQPTGLDKTATWLWDVRPKSADGNALQAKVEVLRTLADGRNEVVESYTRSVPVSVRVGGMKRTLAAIDDASSLGSKLTGLFGTWQKTIAALVALIGALGLLAWKLGLRKTKPVE